jgi:Flp pilus assembly pilin Flp
MLKLQPATTNLMSEMIKPRSLSDRLLSAYIGARYSARGQTLAEYALIFAALGLAVFAAYQSIGNSTKTLGNALSNDLTSV